MLPMSHPERFANLGIKPPKGECIKMDSMSCFKDLAGVLMYGPPGTGKTLMARACAAKSKATFLKLAGPQLVQVWMRRVLVIILLKCFQMFIGDGAKLVRDAFALAKEKAPTIIFIDELDAIGTKVN